MIEAVIFDCDGLIVDTETAWYEAFCDIYRQYGAELPIEKYVQCVGTDFRYFDPYKYLELCTGKTFRREELEQELMHRHEMKMEQAQLRPGVESYLQEASELGLKIGLASSSPRKWVMTYLQRYQIDAYFDTICTADDVEAIKPDPALYILACSRLGVSPERALAFEDSVNGLEAARRAGLRTVVVPNPVTRHLDFGAYDRKIESMAHIRLRQLLDELKS